jgi:hypothetical protein
MAMARSKAATRKAKAEYQRRYRKSSEGSKKVEEYNKATVADRSSRNKARRIVGARGGEVHHKDGNPRNNSRSNLVVAKSGHGGGTGGPNRNAAGRRRKKKVVST